MFNKWHLLRSIFQVQDHRTNQAPRAKNIVFAPRTSQGHFLLDGRFPSGPPTLELYGDGPNHKVPEASVCTLCSFSWCSHLLEAKAANLASCKTHIPFISAFVHFFLPHPSRQPRQLLEKQLLIWGRKATPKGFYTTLDLGFEHITPNFLTSSPIVTLSHVCFHFLFLAPFCK